MNQRLLVLENMISNMLFNSTRWNYVWMALLYFWLGTIELLARGWNGDDCDCVGLLSGDELMMSASISSVWMFLKSSFSISLIRLFVAACCKNEQQFGIIEMEWKHYNNRSQHTSSCCPLCDVSSCQTSFCLLSIASVIGVFSNFDWVLGSAPCCNSRLTIRGNLFSTAQCKGVIFNWKNMERSNYLYFIAEKARGYILAEL